MEINSICKVTGNNLFKGCIVRVLERVNLETGYIKVQEVQTGTTLQFKIEDLEKLY